VAWVGDNASGDEQHRAGLNGIWKLTCTDEPESVFVPHLAGLNLEHVFDGHVGERDLLFEPRRAPMELQKIGETEAELYQPPLPFWGVESWTRFHLIAPYFVDMDFRFRATKPVFRYGYIGLFWASYINAPENKSLYFWGRKEDEKQSRWVQFCTQWHYDESTVMHISETEPLPISPTHPPMLFTNFSRLRFEEPFMFGRWRDRVVAFFFDQTKGVRLTHSPSGGGLTADGKDTNPAWDFQLIIAPYELNREYRFRVRLVYKRWAGREEIRKLFNEWREALEKEGQRAYRQRFFAETLSN